MEVSVPANPTLSVEGATGVLLVPTTLVRRDVVPATATVLELWITFVTPLLVSVNAELILTEENVTNVVLDFGGSPTVNDAIVMVMPTPASHLQVCVSTVGTIPWVIIASSA